MCRQAGSPATSKAKVLACGAAGGIPKILWSAAPFPQINPVLKSSNFPTRSMCPHSPGHGPPRPVQAGQKRERGGGVLFTWDPQWLSAFFRIAIKLEGCRPSPAPRQGPAASLPRTLPAFARAVPSIWEDLSSRLPAVQMSSPHRAGRGGGRGTGTQWDAEGSGEGPRAG